MTVTELLERPTSPRASAPTRPIPVVSTEIPVVADAACARAPFSEVPPAGVGQPQVDRQRVRRRAARARSWRADLLVALCMASVAAAVSLWLAAGGLAGVRSIGSAVTAAGILTGLVGTDLVLVMLVLAARIPLVDRTFGQDRAIALHRRLGQPAVLLLLAHAVLLILGSAITSRGSVLVATLDMLALDDVLLAAVGLGLLLIVSVTSVVAVRAKLPYEAWHAIHLASYAAVAVALPHQLSLGGMLTATDWQRYYWLALYVAAFGSILWFRWIVHVRRSLRHRLRVMRIERVGDDAVSIELEGQHLAELGALGGQYAMWRFWSASTWWHAHPISFSAVPTETRIRITVRALGRGTARIARVRPGTRVSVAGPYGMFTPVARTAPNLALIGAGIGVTPIRALLEQSRPEPGEATVLLRASTPGETYLWQETAALARQSGTPIYGMLGHRDRVLPSWKSAEAEHRGVTLASVFPRLRDSDLYICGPGAWTDLVVREARAYGLPLRQIHVERFDW